jgi:cytochrome P450
MFPDPSTFNAERFLQTRDADSQERECDKALGDFVLSTAFGFGRRVCPGRHLAMNSAWLSMAQILATFDILKEVDKQGREIEPNVGFTNGITSHPEPFKCRLVPRSQAAIDLLHQA